MPPVQFSKTNKSRHFVFLLILLALLLLISACGPDRSASQPTTTSEREVLSCDDLMSGVQPEAPVDDTWLARPEGAAAPPHSFEGRLELVGEAANGDIHYLIGGEGTAPATGHLPEFAFEFVQSGDHLVPVRRGLIVTTHPDWDYLLEPGRVWSEPGDRGWSRTSFPFFLVAKGGNSTLNGVMTFLFNESSVSQVYYQITQETTVSFRADFWGSLEAVYTPGPVAGADEVRTAFESELAGRLPTRPIEQLAEDFPGVDPAAFTRHLSPESLTTWGLVVNGVHYRDGCATRTGEYPYCDWVRMPSFSTAKTAFVAVALLRLEQKYGGGVADLLVRDYLPETASSRGDWSAVTFGDALDMATGNFLSSGFMVDEEGRIFDEFFNVYSYKEKMAAALDWPHSAPPGTVWVYRSSDTFLLVAAMQNFLETKEGPDANIFQFVVNEIYRPVGFGPGFLSTARTSDDNWSGLPLGAMGLWWNPDDAARMGVFLNNEDGALDGEQLLDPALLRAGLQANPNDTGLPIPGGRYNNSFWSMHFGPAQGFACEFEVPYMAGYSGDIIALLPDDITYYYFSDNREFDWAGAVIEANKIAPFCP